MKFTANVAGERFEIEFNRTGNPLLTARINDRVYPVEVTIVQPGVYWFNWNNRSIEVAITPAVDGYTASVRGQAIAVEILDAQTALKKAAQHGHDGLVDIKAPMPGKVVKVLASEGEEVKANQGILVMEAMKMQNEIKSPKKGVVKKIVVNEGVAVNAGEILATVE